jgi:hypothetical protein
MVELDKDVAALWHTMLYSETGHTMGESSPPEAVF